MDNGRSYRRVSYYGIWILRITVDNNMAVVCIMYCAMHFLRDIAQYYNIMTRKT